MGYILTGTCALRIPSPPASNLAPAPSPFSATRSPGCASGSRRARGRCTPSTITASTSSPTPRPGWRHAGGTTSTGPPTSRSTSTRPVSARGAGLGASTRTDNRETTSSLTVKLDPPPTGMPFTKTGGRLQLRVPRPPCHRRGQLPQWEARFQRNGDRNWTQVKTPFARASGDRRGGQ